VSVKIGVDVGGTFTDVVVFDDGVLSFGKVPTTSDLPARGVVAGVEKMGYSPEEVDYFVHGSTIALNAVLERRGVSTALVTTRGFRDVLEIMRTNRLDLYNLQQDKPVPVVPRELRFEVGGRVSPEGDVLEALVETEVQTLAERIRAAEVEAVAVCLLHSYANDEHERRVKELLESALPRLLVTLSSEMVREWREFERTSTAVVNAYIRPLVKDYAATISDTFGSHTGAKPVLMMQSNGGLGSESAVGLRPATTIMSGPVGGVVAAERLARETGEPHLLTLDIGGTSADMCLIRAGSAQMVAEREVDRFPVLVASVDVHAIGAGGGSIAWIDPGGALRCGPRSAGAQPGPACYGRGGLHATVTDAHVVLGTLDPGAFLGGEMPLDVDAAYEAVGRIARALEMSTERAAAGIVRVVDLRMAEALRRLAGRSGQDLREYALLAYGGGGPLHGAQLCRDLDIPRMIVPTAPGTFSALGMLVADVRNDEAVTAEHDVVAGNEEAIERLFASLEAKVEPAGDGARVLRSADLRYEGQEYTLNVPMPTQVDQATLAESRARFEDQHERLYGYRLDGRKTVLATARISVVSPGGGVGIEPLPAAATDTGPAPLGGVSVYELDASERRPWSRYARDGMAPGTCVDGPAVIEESGSTTVIRHGDSLEVDRYGNLVVAIGGRG
jgi:N-methylhydantoinase A